MARSQMFVVFLMSCLLSQTLCHVRIPVADVNMRNLSWKPEASITINASPSSLTSPFQWVTVVWSGVSDPREDDWIGVFSPANVNYTDVSPVKYQYAKQSSKYLRTGSGSLQFDILNMHSDVIFTFMRSGTTFPTFAAASQVVTFDNYNYPMQGHIASTGKASEMRVSWAIGMTNMEQYVQYGTSSKSYTAYAQATGFTYSKSDMCGEPASSHGWKEPGYLQTAILFNLEPSTKYYYRYGSDQSGWSPEYSFVSAPVTGAQSGIRLAAYGDMGKAEVDGSEEHWEEYPSLNTTNNVLDILDSQGLDLVLHIGDIAYAVGFESQWDEFMQQILPVATQVPYMTCIGNHERDWPDSGCYYNTSDSGGECGVPYENRFIMPGTEDSPDEPWYSFDYGNVHFVLMSTEHDFLEGSDQYNFIQSDLASVDRSVTPFVIFAGHRPMYIDSTDNETVSSDQRVAELLRANLEPLLLKYQVDLALWGHHHSYQRTCPVYNLTCQAKVTSNQVWPTHVVIGMAGMALSKNIMLKQPSWIVYVDDQEYGYSVIETTATEINMWFYNNENVLRDHFSRQTQFPAAK